METTHQFERHKIGRGVKCIVCNSVIWSNGYACFACDSPAHKGCAVKARKEPCIVERRHPDGIESRDSVGHLSYSSTNLLVNGNLEIFFF